LVKLEVENETAVVRVLLPDVYLMAVSGISFTINTIKHTKSLITNKCTKRVLSSIVTHYYMFRPCWVIFRENFLLSLH
jgi:hypothetical protein